MTDPRLKDTNPKDSLGSAKVPLGLLSPIAKAHWAAAQHLGKTKYGAWNWRACGVRASVYIDAAGRHLDSFNSGERVDPVDGTHHLGNVMACAAILLEAEVRGNLIDDRPPIISHRSAYAEVEATMRANVERYRDLKPRHYTIADELPPLDDDTSTRVDDLAPVDVLDHLDIVATLTRERDEWKRRALDAEEEPMPSTFDEVKRSIKLIDGWKWSMFDPDNGEIIDDGNASTKARARTDAKRALTAAPAEVKVGRLWLERVRAGVVVRHHEPEEVRRAVTRKRRPNRR